MRKIQSVSIIVCFLLLFTTACHHKSKPVTQDSQSSQPGTSQATQAQTISTKDSSTVIGTQSQDKIEKIPSDAIILNSDNIDTDGDGKKEKITVYQTGSKSSDGSEQIEGRLRIEGDRTKRDVAFIKKQAGSEGIFTSAEYADLDGDGTKDIFIITPDNGSQFNLNFFSIYSCPKDKVYTFNVDNDLNDFTAGFTFKYLGKGLLEMRSTPYNFNAKLDISDSDAYSADDEKTNRYFERSWVEPMPVDIGIGSKLALDTSGSAPVIKVPLPVFGQATLDIIGEVDLYYRITNEFTPAACRFEVYDFNGTEKKKIGEGSIK